MQSRTKNRKTREQVARMAERAFGGTTLAGGEDAVREEAFISIADSVLEDGQRKNADYGEESCLTKWGGDRPPLLSPYP